MALPYFFSVKNLSLVIRALLLIPLILVVRILSPVIVLRFGAFYSSRIGHFAGNTEVYLCEKDAGINRPSRPCLDLFFYQGVVCNQQLKRMWGRTLFVVPFSLFPIEQILRRIPGGSKHLIPTPNVDRDVYGLLDRTPPHISFSAQEQDLGEAGLHRLGVPKGATFICVAARDQAYLNSLTIHPGLDLSYQEYRNADITNYIPALVELTRRGHFVVRMGQVVAEALKTDNPKIIDYATSSLRSEFLDIYLSAKCQFFISVGTGIDCVPMLFRRPTMFVNSVPVEYGRLFESSHLFIPKKHWLRSESRFMTMREILSSGAGRYLRTQQFDAAGIELIENSPDEIRDLSVEMDDRVNGRWKTDQDDEELQRKFWSLFTVSELNAVFRARIGTAFLREHRDWLL
jgi:putative glycosyltransferase (TIGR04372 family)